MNSPNSTIPPLNASSAPTEAPLSESVFYQKYHGAGFSVALVLFFSPTAVVSLVGIPLNASLIYVTRKCKSTLNSAFSVLIALDSLVSALWEFSFLFRFLVPLSGTNFVWAGTCFWLQALAALGQNTQNLLMLAIACERLCGILAPFWITRQKPFGAVSFAVMAISLGYGIFCNAIIYAGIASEFKGKELLCYYGDFYTSWSKAFVFYTNLAFEAATVVAYAIIWPLVLRGFCKNVQVVDKRNFRILKSLSVIMLLIIFGWMLQRASSLFAQYLHITDTFTLTARLTDITFVASASNAPILYIFSSEYRRCYQSVFTWIPRGQNSTTSVQVITPSARLAAVEPLPMARRGGGEQN